MVILSSCKSPLPSFSLSYYIASQHWFIRRVSVTGGGSEAKAAKITCLAASSSLGKSTTRSMLAYVLKAIGDDLTAVIRARVPQILILEFPWMGHSSPDTRSLLNHRRQATGSEYSSGVLLASNLELFDEHY
ncbi:hypothetical protein SO802_024250 [Lithocarpus litseifolius]|uniref:Uncharacterized protein n=1 Tax=Lithocarpus litseifolius TaxID=425828 RepID=A0AAW2CB49_9ROSI